MLPATPALAHACVDVCNARRWEGPMFSKCAIPFVVAVAACLDAAAPASAQPYPSRPITMIMSGAAGTNGDLVGRIIAERMREKLGQPIIIENIGGADGSIGAGRAARAKPDGYTIDIEPLRNHVLNGA